MQKPLTIALALLAFPAIAHAQTFKSSAGDLKVETVAEGLSQPWALAFLPDGRMLVTERPGRMRIVTPDGKLSAPLQGVPKVAASGQGGLHDVVLDRDFAQNKTIYFCFAEPASGGARTAMARAALGDGKLDDVKVIFHQDGPLSSGNHFGCRIAQSADNNLFLTMGDHFTYRDEAQNLGNHLGKIVRIKPDGSVPDDNPFVGRNDAWPEIWSYGHRNSQGAAIHPATGKLWEHEHGPARRRRDQHSRKRKKLRLAGDRLRHRLQRRKNPRKHEQARHGTADQILGAVDRAVRHGVLHRRPVSGVEGQPVRRRARRPDAGAARRSTARTVTGEERLLQGLRERIRDVRVGPDGALYLVTDNSAGRILRVVPAK